MKFVIRFTGEGYYSAIDLPEKRLGLQHLDLARQAVGVPYLAAERVKGKVDGVYENPVVVVTEEQARRSGRFEESYLLEVTVPGGALNKYMHLHAIPRVDETTGEVREVVFAYKLDENELIEDWLSAGAPISWNPGE